uniref:Uncharacterized protein n=1 Tax=Parascaris equorum TaxID=6256 RepID=A0A914RIP1_PAREQ
MLSSVQVIVRRDYMVVNDYKVRRDELSRVARGDLCRINNSLDMTRTPFPPCIVVDRALLMADVAKSVIVGSAALLFSGSVPFALTTGCLGYTLTKLGHKIKRLVPFYPEALL